MADEINGTPWGWGWSRKVFNEYRASDKESGRRRPLVTYPRVDDRFIRKSL